MGHLFFFLGTGVGKPRATRELESQLSLLFHVQFISPIAHREKSSLHDRGVYYEQAIASGPRRVLQLNCSSGIDRPQTLVGFSQ